MSDDTLFRVPLVIRGTVIDDFRAEFPGRRGGGFATAPVSDYLDRLVLPAPSGLTDLHALTTAEIIAWLAALRPHLDFERNRHLQQAFEASCRTSALTPAILRHCYANLHGFFDPDILAANVARTVGAEFLDGWVERDTGAGAREAVRAFGSRAVHVAAGNVPGVAALTIARNALTRGDAIIKSPSNDPLTAVALARTMIEVAPDHPLTRHVSVAYWKGGDAGIEDRLYSPRNLEKIVAWGGFASISHIARHIQPGLEAITLDPKLSSTIIGAEAFADEPTMREVAALLARDIGELNQEACVNARVAYVQTGTDAAGLERLQRFAALVWEALQALPAWLSGPVAALPSGLADEIDCLRLTSDDHVLFGGGGGGGVIASLDGAPVEFAAQLEARVANLVPFDDLDTPVRSTSAYTQTVGIWPAPLRRALRDRLALQGAQRMVPLGYAARVAFPGVQDGMEPMRRMCRWMIDEDWTPANREENVP